MNGPAQARAIAFLREAGKKMRKQYPNEDEEADNSPAVNNDIFEVNDNDTNRKRAFKNTKKMFRMAIASALKDEAKRANAKKKREKVAIAPIPTPSIPTDQQSTI